MQKNCHRLTTNGCLYLNLAFKQTYIMQVLTYSLSSQRQLCLILYDGQAYIGAILPLINQSMLNQQRSIHQENNFGDESSADRKNILKLNVYDIVKVYPQLVIQNQPIVLRSLEVIQSSIDGPLGNQMMTLNQFMHKRSFHRPIAKPIEIPFDQQARKIVKTNNDRCGQQQEHKQVQIEMQFQNQIIQQKPENTQFNQMMSVFEVKEDTQMNHQEICVQQNQIVQNRQIIEDENVHIVNKSASTVMSQKAQEKKDIPMNQQIEIQQFQTQKKGFEVYAHPMRQEQTIKQTQKVSFYQRKSNISHQSMIQQGQSVKQQNQKKKTKASMKQVTQIFEIEDDSQVIIIEKQMQGNEMQQFSMTQNLRKSLVKSRSEQPTMYIKDLYERMHRFQIHCRVNFISKFVSQKGLPCTKLFLIDERGDQIVCMIFEKQIQRQNGQISSLVKGKVYSFQNGEVMTQEDDVLSICVPWIGIVQQRKFFISFNPKKMLRVGQIYQNLILLKEKSQSVDNSKYSKEVSVCGILIGFLEEPKLLKFQFKVVGLLCDPQSQKSVTFTLFVDELSSFPEKGSVVTLHNIRIFQDQHIIRLQPSRRSYILNEKGNVHEYFSQLLKISGKGKYKLIQYRNLSEISFVSRNISGLKNILSKILQHDLAYSQIDCSIIKITEKRIFNACVVCKKETKPEPGLYTYCHNCRKINKYMKRVVFDLEVSDSTGSIQLSLFTTHLEGFINMSEEQYLNHGVDDRSCFLELCTYQNIVLKVKSQRVIGGSNHTAISAEKSSPKRGLSQIVNKIVEDKTKYIACW